MEMVSARWCSAFWRAWEEGWIAFHCECGEVDFCVRYHVALLRGLFGPRLCINYQCAMQKIAQIPGSSFRVF